jgi:hypothetical protein
MDALKVLPIVMMLVSAGPAFAQTGPALPGAPAPQAVNSLSLEVRAVANGGGADNDQNVSTNNRGKTASQTVSQTKTRTSRTTLELKVRNLAKTPVSAQFEYYFVASSPNEGKHIWSNGSKVLTVGPGQEQKELFESDEITQSTLKSVTTARLSSTQASVAVRNVTTGGRPVGWFVRLVSAEGKVIRVVASSAEYEKAGRDPVLLSALQRGAPRATGPGFPPTFQQR